MTGVLTCALPFCWAGLAQRGLEGARRDIDAAERHLGLVGGAQSAAQSPLLEAGLDRRLADLGRALAAGDATDAERALGTVEDHALAPFAAHRVDAARMAVRLVRWLGAVGDALPSPASLLDAAAWYAGEGSWVDWARGPLPAGDRVADLDAAYGALAARVDGVREAWNRRFAALVADWSAASGRDPRLPGVEDLLDGVVAPIAAAGLPVLVLVMDGMSMAVERELAADVARLSWQPQQPVDGPSAIAGLAVVPSVTEVSRASLLAGRIDRGDQAHEKRAFAAHPGLVGHSRRGVPPVLFHKADLLEDTGRGLSARAQTAIADPAQVVVGVVVNAVDDMLMKGDEVRPAWGVAELPLLGRVLDAARAGGRVVVMCSDHGHVLELGMAFRKPEPGGGERWRVGDAPEADEVLVRGPRVALGQGRVVAAATERVRYAPKRAGYHGGATPQEMLVPVRVLASALHEVPGYRDLVERPPAWWSAPADAPLVVAEPPPAPPSGAEQQTSFFDPQVQAAAAGEWIERLMQSPLYAEQRQRAARSAPDDERVRAVLAALTHRGGRMSEAALVNQTGIPQIRLPGVLRGVQRLLNVDGYAVVAVADDGEVSLNRGALEEQFGL